MKKYLLPLLKYGISFLILYVLYLQTQDEQFSDLYQSEKKYGWLTIALFVGIGTALVSFYRWYLLVRALELKFSFFDAVRLGFLGNLLNLISVGVLGGDAIKAVFLARQMPGRGPEAVASVIFDRAIGLLAMFSFASVGYLMTDFSGMELTHEKITSGLHWVCRVAIALSVAGFVGLGILYFTPRFHKSALHKRIAKIPKIGGLFKRLVQVALSYRNRPRSIVAAFLLSIVVNLGFAASFYSIARGISEHHPSITQHLVISPIAMVANAVPLPGGIGGMETAVSFLYKAFSSTEVPSEHGFIVALGFRLVLLIIAGIGFVYYVRGKREIQELAAEAQK